jgi:hypothetical protein
MSDFVRQKRRASRLHITASLPNWVIDDGTYPQFHLGQIATIALQVQLGAPLRPATPVPVFAVDDRAHAAFCGKVLAGFADKGERPVIAIEAATARFYVEHDGARPHRPNDWIEGHGTLTFDPYLWSEIYASRHAAPDIYQRLRVERIRQETLPTLGTLRPVSDDHIQHRSVELLQTPLDPPSNHTFLLDLVDAQP